MAGELILVATPIGNLGDLSARAEEALRSADVIACEDTRHTLKLLSAKGITGKRLLAVHEHNERNAADGLLALIERGERVALVTDAGTPGISDPGQLVVEAVSAAGFPVIGIPGPAALILALTVSGLPTERFVFEGFLPSKGSSRTARLAELALEQRTWVLYEAPHRMVQLVNELVGAVGHDRRVSMSRELTKRFETTWRGPVGDAQAALGEPQGEYVVVVAGASAVPRNEAELDAVLREELAAALASGQSRKDAALLIAQRHGVGKKQVYDLGL
jgi:16S rRNA (cytidine1402-2'-O)-methyltransferase